MTTVIGAFQQFIRNAKTQGSAPVSAPQQGPAAPPSQTAGTGSGGKAPTDSFAGSTPTAPRRNPLFPPDFPAPFTFTAPRQPSAAASNANAQAPALPPLGIAGGVTPEIEAKGKLGIFTVSVTGYLQVDAAYARAAGMTTFTVEAEAGVEGGIGIDVEAADVTVNGTAGVRGSYEVTLPTTAAGGVTSAEQLNPSLPQNLPVGATVTMTGEGFLSAGMEVNIKKLFGHFDISAGFSDERSQGMALAVTKLDDKTVRVTVGPTAAVAHTLEANIGVRKFNVGVSDTARVEGQLSSKQVDFDISTPEGQAAYNRFLATGELPKNDPASGTSNAATVEIVTGEMTREVTFGLNFGESTLEHDEYIHTHYDDGRESFQYTGQKGPASVVISGDPTVPSSQTYEATLVWVPSGEAETMKQSFPGATGTGDTAIFTFTPEEAKQLQQIAKDRMQLYREQRPGFKDAPAPWVQTVAMARTPEEAFLVLMTPTGNNQSTDVTARMAQLGAWQSDFGTGSVVLPGQYSLIQQ
ncbi:hypothetical protein D7Y13_01650 [Corallococcus praedator]|uniref:Uncharacterized protein n=1 Tax=Corallococcus praedator TaxID=2316724 RepID=A0ABX9QRF6_9BACT|nr:MULTISPECIES: hypothetical protein [Corallococcus]RKH20537.1 hypothetical protein D7X74_03690 [Corallococcus sp. CA047B]RKH36167.1 hypothetical protein D7X75_01860 [Corallococcus sp. CA031C]RKI16997.1 hypothetical protein D7Y13_01650 [Corallococcus praedator]